MECETADGRSKAPAEKKMRPCDYAEYETLVNQLASRLKIACHPDPSVTIRAARLLIESALSSNGGQPQLRDCGDEPLPPSDIANMSLGENRGVTRIQRSKFSLEDIMLPKTPPSISTESTELSKPKDELNEVYERAAKALKLLYLDDQKQLQNRVNEIISSIQAVTANPKTDSKLMARGR